MASCKEGFGEGVFERWISEAQKPQDLIDRVKSKFELGGHKAAAIAMVLQKVRVFLVSELDEVIVRQAFLEPYKDVQSAYNSALEVMGEDAKVILVPHGGSILPVLINNI